MGIRDRWDEFARQASLRLSRRRREETDRLEEVEVDNHSNLSDFNRWLKEVSVLRIHLDNLEEDVNQVKAVQNKIETTVFYQEKENVVQELRELETEIKRKADEIRTVLVGLKNCPQPISSNDKALLQTRRQHISYISDRFININRKYQQIQVAYAESRQAKIDRICEITGTELTDEEKDKMLQSGMSMFANQMLLTTETSNLEAAENRHDQIRQLETTLTGLHNLFKEMVEMINAQGMVINEIEESVNDAGSNTTTGLQTIQETEQIIENNRKKKIWIVSILSVTLLVIIGAVIYKLCS